MRPGLRIYERSKMVGVIAGRTNPKEESYTWEALDMQVARDLYGVIGDGKLWTVRVSKIRDAGPQPWEPQVPPYLKLTVRAEVKSLDD